MSTDAPQPVVTVRCASTALSSCSRRDHDWVDARQVFHLVLVVVLILVLSLSRAAVAWTASSPHVRSDGGSDSGVQVSDHSPEPGARVHLGRQGGITSMGVLYLLIAAASALGFQARGACIRVWTTDLVLREVTLWHRGCGLPPLLDPAPWDRGPGPGTWPTHANQLLKRPPKYVLPRVRFPPSTSGRTQRLVLDLQHVLALTQRRNKVPELGLVRLSGEIRVLRRRIVGHVVRHDKTPREVEEDLAALPEV
ncbi:uncharacterized protein LY79DRAFT_584983 [Colletotrichum navitas]|uniref:Uncharacterized protein n=1 Tax=Colletotrichum navitas TaxID=681940 RepID=A0AAD8UXA3_9PEZI|nr:uncharacterized protein LY79DRAFT_584983 [Colletotrichum navitas]KAK1566133.1 hypothetical protein LY79DRAFT_584983 [Colletotrichum navitas]